MSQCGYKVMEKEPQKDAQISSWTNVTFQNLQGWCWGSRKLFNKAVTEGELPRVVVPHLGIKTGIKNCSIWGKHYMFQFVSAQIIVKKLTFDTLFFHKPWNKYLTFLCVVCRQRTPCSTLATHCSFLEETEPK